MGRRAYTDEEEAAIRAGIVRVARELFIDKGFGGVTMRNVAEGVRCSPMRIYRYFPNKRALLRNVWEDVFVRVFETVERGMTRRRSALPALRAFGESYAAYWFDHPDEYRVIFLNQDKVIEENEQYYVYSSSTLERYDRVRQLFERAMGEGSIGTGDPNLMAQQFLCAIHGVVHMLITVPEYPWQSRTAVLGGVINAMLKGIAD